MSAESNPHGEAYWAAYHEAKAMTDDELAAARQEAGRLIREASVKLAAAQGRDASLADEQASRRAGQVRTETPWTDDES